jgi:hypothetical protein
LAKKPRSSAHPALAVAASSAGERLQHFIMDNGLWSLAALVLVLLGVIMIVYVRRRPHTEPAAISPIAQQWEVSTAARHGAPGQQTDLKGPSVAYVPVSAPVDPLLDARTFFDNGDYKAFYREVNRAVWKAIGKKLELPSSELNKQNCVRQLQLRGWDAPSILSLENILNECEMNLYMPNDDTRNMQQLLRQADQVMVRLA